jgi:ABC-type multidrug transport system ATPase subunit
VLVSSHMLAEVAQIAGSVIILTHGRLIAQAPLAELTTQPSVSLRATPYRREDGGWCRP